MGHFKTHQQRTARDGSVVVPIRSAPLTPAQRHKLRTAPEAPAGPDPVSALRAKASGRAAALGTAKSERERFAEAVESLHGLSIAEKLERKRALIEQYRAAVEGLLAAGAPREKLFTWWVVWLYDVGAIEQFIPRARQAIAHGWLTEISRDLQTFLWDMVLEWAQGEAKAGRGVEPYFGQVYPAEVARMIEVVQAKYHKFAGDRHAEQAELSGSADVQRSALTQAIACWEAADAAYDKAGVKTRVADGRKQLEKLGGPVAPDPESAPASEEGETD